MYAGLLGLHSLLRWLLIIFLVINIIRVNVEAGEDFDSTDKKWSLRLLIAAHINLLIGLYQYFSDKLPKVMIEHFTTGDIMKRADLRFWIIEHPLCMILSITLITISHVKSKKPGNALKKHRLMSWLYILALVIMIAGIPWPFRGEDIARPWFRGLYQ
ncbi:hypothetical protein ACFOW1_11640 [Parasediminibacterium paludis]|uniref:Cytochrome B n=1 Tax=Parasediminibacterium paludis TaxID=908966 RepID=A0ABV8PYC4_9BACT